MINHETAASRFLQLYAQRTSEDDISALVSLFADPFFSVDPNGTRCLRVDDFAAALPKKKLLFDRLGCKPAVLTSLQETQLDARYVLARTTWRFEFALANTEETEEILADSTFLIDTGKDDFKIALYMAHQDIMQVLRDRGILQS